MFTPIITCWAVYTEGRHVTRDIGDSWHSATVARSSAVMSCCRVTCHLSSVMSSRGESAALGCDIIAHLDPGHWWTLVDTIMMSSSTDQWWVLGHCTHWTGGAQSAVGHTLYLVPDRASLSLYLYLSISAWSMQIPYHHPTAALLSPCCPTWATCWSWRIIRQQHTSSIFNIDTFQKPQL